MVNSAQRIGAGIGVRIYCKEFELKADGLSVLVSIQAGFNPILCSLFFMQHSDPDSEFLGTIHLNLNVSIQFAA